MMRWLALSLMALAFLAAHAAIAYPGPAAQNPLNRPPRASDQATPVQPDVTTIQKLQYLEDQSKEGDEKLADLRQNTKDLLEASNHSVDVLKDLVLALIVVITGLASAFSYLFFQLQKIKELLVLSVGGPPVFGRKILPDEELRARIAQLLEEMRRRE